MKKFWLGFIAAALVLTLTVGALAASGKLSIEVNTDMRIIVNGDLFTPTDVNGNPVMVFEYNGTTYAPLRALAEAYGLVVSYDQDSRMAIVEKPAMTAAEAAAQLYDGAIIVEVRDGDGYLIVTHTADSAPQYTSAGVNHPCGNMVVRVAADGEVKTLLDAAEDARLNITDVFMAGDKVFFKTTRPMGMADVAVYLYRIDDGCPTAIATNGSEGCSFRSEAETAAEQARLDAIYKAE